MSDYVITKNINTETGQLPDKVTLIIPNAYAWLMIKQLLIQLEQCNPQVSVDVYGTVEKHGL